MGVRVLPPPLGAADRRGHTTRGDHIGFDRLGRAFGDGRADRVRVVTRTQRAQQRFLVPGVVGMRTHPSVGRAPEP